MRKEVEALKQARVIYAGRSESAGNGGAVNLAEAVVAASHVSARLIQAGLLIQEDWEYVAANDLRPAFLTGPGGKEFRRELILRFEPRVTKIGADVANLNVHLVKGVLEDFVSLVIEMAAYKQAYDVMMIGLIDYRHRLPSMRWVPDVRKVSSVVDKSFRACPPEEVLEDATRIIVEEKAKAKWAKAKIARDKKMPGGRPKMRFRTRRMSPSEVTDLFHSRAMSQRLKRALPGRDLFPDAAASASPVVLSSGDAPG